MSRTYRKLPQPRKQDQKRFRLSRPTYREDGMLTRGSRHAVKRAERCDYRRASQDLAGDAIEEQA